uniref:Uncharacterized protein n=1 Tax=Brassica oleracea TaxID=3712 RepID=A0A3P6EYI7_BRAOL|nr:unnamed protein product [Brassica oleracea]
MDYQHHFGMTLWTDMGRLIDFVGTRGCIEMGIRATASDGVCDKDDIKRTHGLISITCLRRLWRIKDTKCRIEQMSPYGNTCGPS